MVKTADSQNADLRSVVVGEKKCGRKEAGQVSGKEGLSDLDHTHTHTQSQKELLSCCHHDIISQTHLQNNPNINKLHCFTSLP